MLLAARRSMAINSASDSDWATTTAGGCSAESSASEDHSTSSNAAIDILSSSGAPKETLGLPRDEPAPFSGSSMGLHWEGPDFHCIPDHDHPKVTLTNAAAESLRPDELGWVEPEGNLIMNESRDLNVAMDMRSQCGHEPSTNAVSACLWPRYGRQRSCPLSEVRRLPHPAAHGRKEISKDTLNNRACCRKLLF